MNSCLFWAYLQWVRFVTLSSYRNKDWRKKRIKECHEKLVEVPPNLAYPFYTNEMGLSSDPKIYLRQGLLDRFLIAKEYVSKYNPEYYLVVYDGWRSLEIQEKLFWIYLKLYTIPKFKLERKFELTKNIEEIRLIFSELSTETQITLREANRQYVSWPSDDPLMPSPHFTGGSVDVWLHSKGVPVNLGVPFDYMYKEAGCFYHLNFFNKRSEIKITKQIAYNRSLMIYSMHKAGFSCYGPEFWHFNYGNQMDALVKGGDAKYGIILP